MASFCAYPAWYIFPRWRRSRAPTGPPLGRLIYRAPFRPTVRSFLFVSRCPLLFPPRFLSPYVRSRASRSSSRHAVSSGVSSCASRCVVSSVLPSCRLACSSHRFGLSSRMGAVSFCCSLVSHSFHSSSFVRPGFCLRHEAGWGRHGHGEETVCSRRLIRPLIVHARYSLTRCWMITGKDGYGAPFRSAVRSFLSYSCPVVLPYLVGPSLPLVSSSPHQRSKKTNETETGRRRRRMGNRTRRPTRRNDKKPDETRAADCGNDTRRTSKQQDAMTRRRNTRRGNETPSDENERTTTTTKGNWDRAAL